MDNKRAYIRLTGRIIRFFINQCRFFASRNRRLNLCFLMLEEIILSCFGRRSKEFCDKWNNIPKKELDYLSQHYDLSRIDKVIIVGAGAIPYTAIFFSKKVNKPVYLIEKNYVAAFVAFNILRRSGINNFKIIRGLAQDYNGYINSLVIITLHTVAKQRVIERVLNCRTHNNIITIRQPSEEYARFYESVCLDGLDYMSIKHPIILESIVLEN